MSEHVIIQGIFPLFQALVSLKRERVSETTLAQTLRFNQCNKSNKLGFVSADESNQTAAAASSRVRASI